MSWNFTSVYLSDFSTFMCGSVLSYNSRAWHFTIVVKDKAKAQTGASIDRTTSGRIWKYVERTVNIRAFNKLWLFHNSLMKDPVCLQQRPQSYAVTLFWGSPPFHFIFLLSLPTTCIVIKQKFCKIVVMVIAYIYNITTHFTCLFKMILCLMVWTWCMLSIK